VQIAGAKPVPVDLTAELRPFEMPTFSRAGMDSQLAATSMLWSSQHIGAVVEDDQGLFHAVETKIPRPRLGDAVVFTKAKKSKFKAVTLVALPIVEVSGSAQRPSAVNPCHVAAVMTALRPSTKAGQDLATKMATAVTDWEKWWARHVRNAANPPSPPKTVSDPFVEVASVMFHTPIADIGVVSKIDEMISDKVSIDFFNNQVRGRGGSTRSDIDARVQSASGGDLKVILQLQAEAFKTPDPIFGLLGTGIHEAAHYRHYAMTRQLIKLWQKSSRANKSRKVTSQVLLTDFGKFIGKQVKAKKLGRIEELMVYSTFGVRQATHPIAQFHGFMGTYPLYPPERSGKGATGGLVSQARFLQLQDGAVHWGQTNHPLMNTVPFEAIAGFAKTQGKCAVTDLLELAKEISTSKTFNKKGVDFFVKLEAALTKP
jgi:hypothetical protein